MRYSDSTLGNLLKPICRRWFDRVVDRHDGDAYDKSFGSWDHLVALIYATLNWHYRDRRRDRITDQIIRDRYEHNQT